MNMYNFTYINWADEKLLAKLINQNSHGVVLDVGCGNARVKKYLPKGTKYIGMDAKAGSAVTVVGDVHRMPFEDQFFDTVVCTAVLEHVKDDSVVLKEIYRVLKPGGNLVTTIPFIHHYHKDPEDYRRYSHVGLCSALENIGFVSVQTKANCGVFTVIEYALFCVLVNAKKEKLFITHWFLFPYYIVILILFLITKFINYLFAPLQKWDTSMYVGVAAVARKP